MQVFSFGDSNPVSKTVLEPYYSDQFKLFNYIFKTQELNNDFDWPNVVDAIDITFGYIDTRAYSPEGITKRGITDVDAQDRNILYSHAQR